MNMKQGMKYSYLLLLLLFSCQTEGDSDVSDKIEKDSNASHLESEIDWQTFDTGVFERAKSENKLVFLEVGANWCHWCHVMDEKTYADAEVQNYLDQHFILCREDQDSRPDLYASYKPWGWPAIIAFDAEKNEIMRLKGYQEKNKFLRILKKTVEQPIPLEDNQPQASELNTSHQQLFNKFLVRLDHKQGMYNWNHKYLHLPGTLHGIQYYTANDSLKRWTDITIENSFQLIDPVWGGAYQYSAKRSWDNQHYEKLLRVQANYIEGYSRYYLRTQQSKTLKQAGKVVAYCERFLSAEEGSLFYNSQNADVVLGEESTTYYSLNEKERLKKGTPSVDQHIYLKENAMIARSMIYYYFATASKKYKAKSIEMTNELIAEYKTDAGIYKRNQKGENQLAFEDNRVFLELFMLQYQAFGDDKYLQLAIELGERIIQRFDSENGLLATVNNSPIESPIVQVDNLNAVLTFNFLGHLSSDKSFIAFAQNLYKKLDQQELIKTVGYVPLLLRAEKELKEEPFHAVLISDKKSSAKDFSYYKTILAHGNPYILFDRAIIGAFNEEQELLYGGMDSGTLFMCTSSFCSAPIVNESGLQEFLKSN